MIWLQNLGVTPIASNSLQPVRSDGQEQIIWYERTMRNTHIHLYFLLQNDIY